MAVPFNTAAIIRCYTTEHMNDLKAQDPTLQVRLDIYEQRMQADIRRRNGGGNAGINVEVIT